MISVRIITADHYMSHPLHDLDVTYSDFRGSEVNQVPIIRIFGSTPTGKKVCLHVHGVFPYIYVPHDGLEQKDSEAYKLASSLDKAINVSLGKSNAVTQHVYKISHVSGRPFYGYHSKEHQFYKIFFYNPIMVKRASDLLQSGAVLSKSFQPHEAHLTFILQFFIDFNLYGMNFINLSEVNFRRPITAGETKTENTINISSGSIGILSFEHVPEELYLPESVSRMSFCELECDALATAILNKSRVSEKMTVIPGLASIWEEERERRRLHGLSSQLSPALSQTRKSSVFTETELRYVERINNQFLIHEQADSPSISANSENESTLDTSGYPSETPENATLQNASLVEVQLPTQIKYIKKKTSDVSDVHTSQEKNQIFPSQNSIKFDSQDELLVDAWEGMLVEQQEDSILGSQLSCEDNSNADIEVEDLLQQEVEDNHLLEMSQVFDWEEKTESKACTGLSAESDVKSEEKHHEDSIFGSQLPYEDNSRPDDKVEDLLQQEVEDNHLLEMSQVFDWEEKTESKACTGQSAGSDVNSEERANVKRVLNESKITELQEHTEKELNTDIVEDKELKTREEDEVCGFSEWEDYIWDDEDEDNFEISPIAQLDGMDDFIEPKDKTNSKTVNNLSKQRRTLGIRRQLTVFLKKDSPIQTIPVSSPTPGTSTSKTSIGNATLQKDKPSNSVHKLANISKSKPFKEIEEFSHQIVAKHKRIHELRRTGRLSLSQTKEKLPSNRTSNKSPTNVTESNKKDMEDLTTQKLSQIHQNYHLRKTVFDEIKEPVECNRQSSSSVSAIGKKLPFIKPCTVRLELIDAFHLKFLCHEHNITISDSSLNQLRNPCLKGVFSPVSELKETKEIHNSDKKISNQISYQHFTEEINSSQESDTRNQINVDQKSIFSATRSNTTRKYSLGGLVDKKTKTSEIPVCPEGILMDNSFSDLDTVVSKRSSNFSSSNSEKAEKKASSPKTPKKIKDKTGSDRNYYQPLKIIFQKSPVRLKNKEKPEDLTPKSFIYLDNSQKYVDKSQREEGENDISSEGTSNFNESMDIEKCMIEKSVEFKIFKEKEEQTQSLESVYDSEIGDQSIKDKLAVRKKLQFPVGPLDKIENNDNAKSRTCSSSSESDHDSGEPDTKQFSESSENDDELGILSFCEEDVFNFSILTPSFVEKPVKKSIISTQSPLIMQEDENKQRANKEETSKSDKFDLKDFETDLTFSSDKDSEEIQDTMDIFDVNYDETFDDNGTEYAPLLRAPSWKEVANYKDGQEPGGLLYCSDPDDIPNKLMEIGEVVLKLHSNRPNSLPPFENCLEIAGLESHRKKTLENMFGGTDELEIGNQLEKISKTALLPDAGSKEVIITPLQNPPKYEEVCKWMTDLGFSKIKKILNEVSVYGREEKTLKYVVRCPMEGNSDDEDLEVISLSPCSTSSSQEVVAKRLTMQSTPRSSVKQTLKCSGTPSQNENCLEFSPIQAESDEDIILCTPPSANEDESSVSKKGSKIKSSKLLRNRKRLLRTLKSRKNILRAIKEESLNSSPKNSTSDEVTSGESVNTKKLKILEENQPKLLSPILNKQRYLVGLGGSGHSSCQIDGISPNNTFGFQNSPSNLQNAKAIQKAEHVTVMTMEVHVKTRGDFRPDPEYDPIQAIFYSVMEDGESQSESVTGVILVDITSKPVNQLLRKSGVPIKSVQTGCDELSMFEILRKLMRKWDPDIVAGYEVEMLSWGYVLERGTYLGLDVKSMLSRVPTHKSVEGNNKDKPKEPFEMDSKRIKDFEDYDPINLPGRIVLNVWRLMRSEVALTSYTFENIMYHLLHERVPLHSFKSLNDWWEHRTHLYRWITVEHWITRVEGVMRLLFQLDIIGRTSELARLFGIQFYEVFSRGSQFRVESIMLRFAKPLNYVCVSPNSKQRASMRAPEQLPLIMEPESRFFADPVIVLDFQSLYPSIIIAYNYCFSTCLGRVKHLGQVAPFEFGCTTLMVPPEMIAKLLNKQRKLSSENKGNSRSMISFSPCGVAFVGKEVREGILPRMLSEILETRLMVKKALKENKGNRVVERVLNSRQLGLKLIANVTYGYTSANFSGRMPCIEVGDSVVSKGRETLERAIDLVHKNWGSQGVRVIYGDTDSLFVLAKGFSRPEAFKLGAKIAELVTESNPSPVKLKLEKIFQPCLLQTKKRYVGYAYESPDQENPVFDAKGIETVRRDGCPAVAKVLGKSLRLLFDTRDVSLVKLHVQRQLGKLLSGRLSLQELTFAREYRGAAGYRPGACVPALQLARRWISIDRRAEPRSGERVPYVIISGPPGLPLFHLVRSPHELIMINKQEGPSTSTAQPPARVNAHYYITRVLIPPLQRCFSLIGVDVESWYADMPRKYRSLIQPRASGVVSDIVHLRKLDKGMENYAGTSAGLKRSTISEYFASSDCISCGSPLDPGSQAALCLLCLKNAQKTAFILASRCNSWERTFTCLTKICQSCCKRMEPIECTSLDCPVLYRRNQALIEMEQATTMQKILSKLSW